MLEFAERRLLTYITEEYMKRTGLIFLFFFFKKKRNKTLQMLKELQTSTASQIYTLRT